MAAAENCETRVLLSLAPELLVTALAFLEPQEIVAAEVICSQVVEILADIR